MSSTGPPPALVVEVRVRVPALVPGAHEEGGAADRLAEAPAVEELPRRLVRAAEEGVGRAADAAARAAPPPRQRRRLGEGDAERLLGIDVLAGGDDLRGSPPTCAFGIVRLRTISIAGSARSSSTPVPPARRTPPRAAAPPPGRRSATARMSSTGKSRRRREVGAADVAAADDADSDAVQDVPHPAGPDPPGPCAARSRQKSGGDDRNRTGVHGFAIRTKRPRSRRKSF